jgi:hypothetical protein
MDNHTPFLDGGYGLPLPLFTIFSRRTAAHPWVPVVMHVTESRAMSLADDERGVGLPDLDVCVVRFDHTGVYVLGLPCHFCWDWSEVGAHGHPEAYDHEVDCPACGNDGFLTHDYGGGLITYDCPKCGR